MTDVQGYQEKFDNQRALLAESDDLCETDHRVIERWVAHLRTNDSDVDSLGTVVGHLNRIRLAAERSAIPLTESGSIEGVNLFKLALGDDHGLSEGTIRNYMNAVRKFLIWSGAEFGEDAVVGASIDRKHDPDEEITAEGLDDLLNACNAFSNAARDKATIALLRDTGLHIGTILSFRKRHVTVSDARATVTINTEANVKGADGPKLLTWSRGYVANRLDVHPQPNDPDAALIHKTSHLDPDDDGALSQQYAGRRVTKTAVEAGSDGDRVHAHLFRGTAISEWIRNGFSDQRIKHRADWGEGSRQTSAYSRVTDEEFNDAIFEDYGLVEETTDNSPSLDQCVQCRTPLRGSERFCPGCAMPLQSSAADATEEVEERTFESVANADNDDAALLAEWRRRFTNDAESRERVVSGVHTDPSSS